MPIPVDLSVSSVHDNDCSRSIVIFLYLMHCFANCIYIFRSNDILHNFSNDFPYVSIANRNNIELFNFIFSRSTQLYFMYVHVVLHIPEVSFSFLGTLITCRRGKNTSIIIHGFSILPSRPY